MSVYVDSVDSSGKITRTVFDTFNNWNKILRVEDYSKLNTKGVNTMLDENDEYQEKLAKSLYGVIHSSTLGIPQDVYQGYVDLLEEGGYVDEKGYWIDIEDFNK